MSAYRAQARIDAPMEDVWGLSATLSPAAWRSGSDVYVGDAYTQVLEIAGRRFEYSRVIDRRDELEELK